MLRARRRAAQGAVGEHAGEMALVVDRPAAVGAVAGEEADPTEDFHASAEYRKALVATLLERSLLAAAKRDA